MRIALLSDVHGNLPAFEAVLADVDSEGVNEIWCLGDLVGYGAQPDACVELAARRCDLCLAGNHDLVVTGAIDIADFSVYAAAAAQWTRDHIGAAALEFLKGLAPERNGEEIGLFHASPRDPVWEYVLSTWQAEEPLGSAEVLCAVQLGGAEVRCGLDRGRLDQPAPRPEDERRRGGRDHRPQDRQRQPRAVGAHSRTL